ncbi:hypothetical protein [Bifidobacterium leontopitheci]|uniref:DUF4177 domain-containing protein n=2 Tax=Bifidobacterium leontopitheci TaxID=2650774 RepID=A0A6I1GDZ0_9BIFI|nr:hypothetical protein [Bifidobacterium leontopitheci]KAB7789850.1 hypothetical protein F7D09_1642 [Bifidobacterium leontopitheci]
MLQYKTVVMDYAPKAATMAANIEQSANDMAGQGWRLTTMSITNSAKAILVFERDA